MCTGKCDGCTTPDAARARSDVAVSQSTLRPLASRPSSAVFQTSHGSYFIYTIPAMKDRSDYPSHHERTLLLPPLSYFSFQPVLHDWCNKGCGMCYPVCGIVHIKEPLLLIEKSSLCGGSGFPLSLSEWSFTICLTPYNRR